MLGTADYTAPTRQHELDQESVCPEDLEHGAEIDYLATMLPEAAVYLCGVHEDDVLLGCAVRA